MSAPALCFRAGPTAYAHIDEHGFGLDQVSTLVGASGGAKWLVLSQLDKVLLEALRPRATPLSLIGSSIGAWRFACYARTDGLATLNRLEHGYINQSYSGAPTASQVSQTSREILDLLLGVRGAQEIVTHPQMRLNIVTARARGPVASERRGVLLPALGVSAAANVLSRRALGGFFERVVFADARQAGLDGMFADDVLATRRVPLAENNVIPAVLASGSIPLVLEGVRDIPGGPPGVYRDGGVIDYHFDSTLAREGLVLYPHFFGHLAPGWFDKMWPRRRAGKRMWDRALLMYPSPEFIAALPQGRVPDRHDFINMSNAERLASWNQVVAACGQLADELRAVLEHGLKPPVLALWNA